jgi:hypothetical protein
MSSAGRAGVRRVQTEREDAVRLPAYPHDMAAEQPLVKQAPISTPLSEMDEIPTPKGRPAGRMLLGYIVWGSLGAVIGVIELLAAINADWTPWPTLSSTVGELQRNHTWVGIFVVGGIVVMAMRILFYPWPYKEPDK